MAPQITSPLQTTETKGTGKGFSFGTLRSAGLDLQGLKGFMFSDLLAQAVSTQTQPDSSNQSSSQAPAQASDNSAPSQTSDDQESISGDRAALRSLMQRIRQDAKALYQSRQRIKHVEKQDHARPAQDSQSKQDDADAAQDATAADTTTAAASTDTQASTTNSDDTTTTTATTDQTTDTTATADVASLLTTTTQDASQTTTTASTTDTKSDTKVDTDAILQDMIQAEQAALLLLNKIRSEKTAQGKSEEGAVMAPANTGPVAAQPTTATPDLQDVPNQTANTAAQTTNTAQGTGKTAKEDRFPWMAALETDSKEDQGNAFGQQLKPFIQSMQMDKAEGKHQDKGAENSATAKGGNSDFLNLFNFSAAPAPAKAGNTSEAAVLKANAASAIGELNEAPAQATASTTNTSTQTPIIDNATKPVGSYSFASELSAARATKGGATGLPDAVEQVTLQLNKLVKDGKNEMTVNLRPAELGRVEIKLSFSSDNKVHGTVVADNPVTLDLLSKDVGSLQRALQEAGLRADPGSLQFSLRGDNQQNFFNANSQGGNSSGNSSSSFMNGNLDETEAANDLNTEVYYLTPGRINFRV